VRARDETPSRTFLVTWPRCGSEGAAQESHEHNNWTDWVGNQPERIAAWGLDADLPQERSGLAVWMSDRGGPPGHR